MSGGNRNEDHRKLAAGIVCGGVLLAGLAAGNHWHRAARAGVPSPLTATLASNASAAHPSSAPASASHASSPPAMRPLAISHPGKRTAAPKSSTSELHSAATPPPTISPVARAQAIKTYAALPMMFEANDGQTDPRVKFLSRAPGYTLFLTDNEAVLSLPDGSQASASARAGQPSRTFPHPHRDKSGTPRLARTVRLKFAGGSTPTAINGRDQLPSKSNYFIGNDPKQWRTNVPNYSAVEYRGIYSGVDAVFHGDNRRLEFDFDLAPGADPNSIALEVEGAQQIRLDSAGDVVLDMDASRDVIMGKPLIYQQSPNGRHEIAGHYLLAARNRIAFELGPYDHSQPLVIDPTLAYSTYLGGSAEDLPYAIAADSSGSAYIVGQAFSPDFPVTAGAYQTSCTQTGATTCTPGTAFVTKLSPDGSSLAYSTFLNGHTGEDEAFGIAVDSSGAAYIAGDEVGETDFPTTPGAIQPVCSGGGNPQAEVFVAKLDSTGSNLDYSTCLQSSIPSASNDFSNGSSYAGGIAVDADGNAYVTGETDLPQNFPTTQGAFQTTCQQDPLEGCIVIEDPFVVKIDPTGTTLLYSTFLSGGAFNSYVETNGIAVDSLGNAYVIGFDWDSGPFPAGSPGGLLTTPGSLVPTCTNFGCGGFLAKINTNATALVYSTYLANVNLDAMPAAVAVNLNGEAYVAGYTQAPDFPTTVGALQHDFTPPGATTANLTDGFVVKMGFLGASYEYATFLGGTAYDTEAAGIAIDAAGHAFITGTTGAGYPATPDAFQTTTNAGANQVFFSELDPDGATLLYSTFLAGTTGEAFDYVSGYTGASYLATDPSGNAYVTGQTDSTDFPTTSGAFQKNSPVPVGSQSQYATGFVAKFSFPQPVTLTLSPTTIQSGTAGAPYSPVTFTAPNGQGTVTISESGSLPAGMAFSGGVLSGTPTQTGSYPITITATDSEGDSGSENPTLVINCPTITVGPSTLANGIVGTVYPAVAFFQTGGVGSVTFSEAGLPTGIGMSFVGGVLSGTPTTAENSLLITVTATDSNQCSGSVIDTLTINSVVIPPAVVTDNETITVTDAEMFPDVADSESIKVTDGVTITPLIAVTAPVVSFSTSSLGFGAIAAGTTGTQTITVSNTGEGQTPLTLSSAAISPSGTPFSIGTINCSNGASSFSTALPSGGACLVTISYVAPASGTPPSATITFTDNAALSNLTSTLSGSSYMQTISLNAGGTTAPQPSEPPATVPVSDNETITVTDTEMFPDVADSETITVMDGVTVTPLISITAPVASFSTSSLGFGTVTAGTTGTQFITVSNVGEGQTGLTLSSAAISPSGTPFSIGTISCSNGASSFSTTVPSGGACLVAISYVAPASGTPPSAAITFTDNAALSNLTSTLSGSSYTQSISLNGGGTTAPQPTEPPATVPVTDNETITVTDTPAFPKVASFANYSNPGPIDFVTNLNTATTQQLVLQNTGGAAFSVSGITFSGASSAFSVTNVVCNGAIDFPFSSVSLGPNQSCTITLQFAPTSYGSGQAELLTILDTASNSNATTAPQSNGQSFLLLGDATRPYASFSVYDIPSTRFRFGTTPVNTPVTAPITVTNTGNGPLTLQFVYFDLFPGAPSTGFSYTQVICNGTVAQFPITLNNGQSCTVTVQFDPASAGNFSATLHFLDNAEARESNISSTPVGPLYVQSFRLSGRGYQPVADLSISAISNRPCYTGSLCFFGTTLSNKGPDTATDMTVTYNFSSPVQFGSLYVSTAYSLGCPLPPAGSTVSSFSCNFGSFGRGGSLPVFLLVTPLTTGTLTLNATISSSTSDPNTQNNSSSASSNISAPPAPPVTPAPPSLSFPPSGTPTSVGHAPSTVVLADFNGDGIADMAVVNTKDNTVAIFIGNINGTFYPATHSPYSTTPFGIGNTETPISIAVGDFNGDGNLDIAVTTIPTGFFSALGNLFSGQIGGGVSILLGNGDGTFKGGGPFNNPNNFGTNGNLPTGIAVADFNGDGNLDLAITNLNSNNVSIMLGDGQGNFKQSVLLPVGTHPAAVAAGRFNQYGGAGGILPDLAVANADDGTVSILINVAGTFQQAPESPVSVGIRPVAISSTDLNHDGVPDLVVANYSSSTVSVLLGNGDGTFATAANFPVGSHPISLALADVNNDGAPDVLVANNTSNLVSVLLGIGDGSFRPARNFEVIQSPQSLAIGSFAGGLGFGVVSTPLNQVAVYADKFVCPAPAPGVSFYSPGIVHDPFSKLYTQAVTLTNTTRRVIPGPIYLMLDGLSSNAGLQNSAGQSRCGTATVSLYVSLTGPLNPGASAHLTLEFSSPSKSAPISYKPVVLAGSVMP